MKGLSADDFRSEKGWKHDEDKRKQVQGYSSKHYDPMQNKFLSTFDFNAEK